jgi:hypothetical protein
MKKIDNFIPLLFLTILLLGSFASCKKDDSGTNNGVPSITYIRVTEPLKSDSLLAGAFQSNLIAIIGVNLQNAQQVWFNDQRASLTPTYITSTTILVSVPSIIPQVIDNKLKIVFANGDTLKYAFKVLISEPIISNMKSEYVPAGGVATINGDFFYKPLTVAFTGGVNGEIVSVDPKIIKVKVPNGALPGQITVTTNFGATKSNFWFRDNRNIIISSDPFTGWWNASFVVNSPGTADVPSINGNYIRVKKVISSWSWNELAGGPASAMGDISKNIPDEAILKPALYDLKFEVNTIKPYNNSIIVINVGLNSENNGAYKWLPPYDTKGEWQTVVIPFEEVTASYESAGSKLAVNPAGYWTRILMQGPGTLDCDMSFDNFRVVPKTIKK